jgi:Uma2 family endonuclease
LASWRFNLGFCFLPFFRALSLMRSQPMATLLAQLTPHDHGRLMSLADFDAASSQWGHRYELIDGRVCVSPVPGLSHERVVLWLFARLLAYSQQRPDVCNLVSPRSRLFAERDEPCCPEPDIAAFRNFNPQSSLTEQSWDDLVPLLAVEVLSAGNETKDTVRNLDVYLDVPTLLEYWMVDPLDVPTAPVLRVRQRLTRRRWRREVVVPFGGTYTSPNFPDLNLLWQPQ